MRVKDAAAFDPSPSATGPGSLLPVLSIALPHFFFFFFPLTRSLSAQGKDRTAAVAAAAAKLPLYQLRRSHLAAWLSHRVGMGEQRVWGVGAGPRREQRSFRIVCAALVKSNFVLSRLLLAPPPFCAATVSMYSNLSWRQHSVTALKLKVSAFLG